MKTASLGEIAQWGSGGTPKRGVADYFGAGVPWLSIADLNDGIVLTAKESLTEAGIANSSAKVVPAGTLFVAMYGSIGKLGIAGSEMATSQAIAFAMPDERRVDRRYLFHFLLAERPRLQALGRGGTQMNIGQADLKARRIPLPPLPEQRRVAAVLDQADALRVNRLQALDRLNSLTGATFREMFAPGRHVKRRLWELVRDARVGLVRAAAEVGPDLSTPYMKMDAITRDGGFDRRQITRTDASDSERQRFEAIEGDLIFNTRNSRQHVGKTTIFRGPPALYNNNLMRIRFCDEADPIYVHSYLWSFEGQRQLEARKSGTTSVFAIYAKDLMTLEIPVPPIERQREFVSRVEMIGMRRAIMERSLSADDELFASLQYRAFRGEL